MYLFHDQSRQLLLGVLSFGCLFPEPQPKARLLALELSEDLGQSSMFSLVPNLPIPHSYYLPATTVSKSMLTS